MPFLLCPVGGLMFLIVFGNYCGTSLPYPDSTPELLDIQCSKMAAEEAAMLSGGAIFLTGVAWSLICPRCAAEKASLSEAGGSG